MAVALDVQQVRKAGAVCCVSSVYVRARACACACVLSQDPWPGSQRKKVPTRSSAYRSAREEAEEVRTQYWYGVGTLMLRAGRPMVVVINFVSPPPLPIPYGFWLGERWGGDQAWAYP